MPTEVGSSLWIEQLPGEGAGQEVGKGDQDQNLKGSEDRVR